MLSPRLLSPALLAICLAVALFSCGGGGGGSTNPPDPGVGIPRILKFLSQPQTGLAGEKLPPIRIELVDAATLPPGPDDTVQVSLLGAQLGGATTQSLVGGVATFDDLIIEKAAKGLSLVATFHTGKSVTAKATSDSFDRAVKSRRHVIVMIADGWGYQHVAAMESYQKKKAAFDGFSKLAMSTWDVNTRGLNRGKGYDPTKAWTSLLYLVTAATDSASSGTAIFTGVKTKTGRIGVSQNAKAERLLSLAQLAKCNGLGLGAVSSVPVNHATPASLVAHNDSRNNLRTIADEMLFGDPAHTGTAIGAHGKNTFLPDVLIGGGHPATSGGAYVNWAQFTAARNAGWTIAARFDENGKIAGDAVARMLTQAATAPRLFGLFGGANGNLPFRLHDGSGRDKEEPTLGDMTRAALVNLQRKDDGFVLLVEGGAVDWAGHANDMSQMLGEMIDFDLAVGEVVRWIEDRSNGSNWNNTLLIVTGDHETGLLTAGPGVFPQVAMGAVTDAKILKEQFDFTSNLKASWDDTNANQIIDPGETVHWTWHTGGHSNSLIPCYYKGFASDEVGSQVVGADPVRGSYIDNTSIHAAVKKALER